MKYIKTFEGYQRTPVSNQLALNAVEDSSRDRIDSTKKEYVTYTGLIQKQNNKYFLVVKNTKKTRPEKT